MRSVSPCGSQGFLRRSTDQNLSPSNSKRLLNIFYVPSQIYNYIFSLFKNTSKCSNISNYNLEFNTSFPNKRKFITILYLKISISLKGEIRYFTPIRVANIFLRGRNVGREVEKLEPYALLVEM